jgi:hypothetical protein
MNYTMQNNSSCPVCRTTIARSNRMLPNVSLDSTIDKYIELLGTAGITEWRRGSGKSYIEWVGRKESVFYLAFTSWNRPLISNFASGLGRTRWRNVSGARPLLLRLQKLPDRIRDTCTSTTKGMKKMSLLHNGFSASFLAASLREPIQGILDRLESIRRV